MITAPNISPFTLEIVSTVTSMILTASLAVLYWKQYLIQKEQKEIMKSQNLQQKANLRSFIEVSGISTETANPDSVEFTLVNKGKSNISNIRAWLHLDIGDGEFDTLSDRINEEIGLDLHQAPLQVEKVDIEWPEAGNLYSWVIEPGESVKFRSRLYVHNEDCRAVYLSEILEYVKELEDIDFFGIHLSVLYKDATDEFKSSRILGLVSFDSPESNSLEECFDNMDHGFVLSEGRAVEEYTHYIES